MKSSAQELGAVIEHHEWVEGMEIGVGTESNTEKQGTEILGTKEYKYEG